MQPLTTLASMSPALPMLPDVLRVAAALLFAVALVVGALAYGVWFDEVAPPGSWAAPLAWNLALFTAFALHHSVLARTRVKQWVQAHAGPGAERSLYVLIASLLFLVCCLAWAPLSGTWYEARGPWRWLDHGLQLTGAWVTLAAARALDLQELAGLSPPRPVAGPLPADARPLETRGLYGLVRHPIYFGWVLLMAGAPVMTSTRASFALISIGYLVLAIPLEERSLVESFGESYRDYQRRVRWRMVPGVY